MGIITDEILDKVAALSELELDNDERIIIRNDMETILDYIDTLNEIDMNDKVDNLDIKEELGDKENKDRNVENKESDCEYINGGMNLKKEKFRDDVVSNKYDKSIVSGAPYIKDGFIVVPKTVK